MTEVSRPWAGTSTGDKGPYTIDQWRLLLETVASAEGANVGVVGGYLNSLEPTSPANDQISANTGRAIVDGTVYANDAAVTKAMSTPSVGTTGKQLVLQKDWTAQTVRVAVISSADGTATIPSLTQSDGVTWEIPLCSFTHATDGTIAAVTDLREFTRPMFINIILDGSGAVLTTGQFAESVAIPKCVITGWEIVGDASGSIVIDVGHTTSLAAVSFAGDSIAGSEKPTLSSAQENSDYNLTTWTRNLGEGRLGLNIDSVTTITRANLTLKGYRP